MPDTNSLQGNQNQKPSLTWSQPAAAKQASEAKPATPVAPVKPAPATSTATTTTHATATQGTSNTGTYVGIFVAGIVIGALIGWGITSGKSGNVATTATSTNSTSTMAAAGNNTGGSNTSSGNIDLSGSSVGSGVTLASSEQAGFAVTVSKISLTQPTWLVVFEDHGGTRGNAIGAGLFFPGDTSASIQLVRPTVAGQSYLVGQMVDNGDRTFSMASDQPVHDSQGNPLYTQFTAK